MTFKSDKANADKYTPELMNIVRANIPTPCRYVVEAPRSLDRHGNADLLMIQKGITRIACRVRAFKNHENYPGEFTVRYSRPSGNKTEFAKVIEGLGDYILFAWENKKCTGFVAWFIGDLRVFRSWVHRFMVDNGKEPGITVCNKDRSSCFKVFSVFDVQSDFVVAQNGLR